MVDYRSSDRRLDEQIVSDLIAVQFPDLDRWPVTRFGAGWDNEPWAELRTELAAAADLVRIDFTDAMVGEPVLDFAGLIGIGGYPFIERVVARYDLPLGAGFAAKLEWLCRVLTLTWLVDAATGDPADIPKHLSWVAHAFSLAR